MGALIPLRPTDLEREAAAVIDYRRYESDDLAAVERARERVVRAPDEATRGRHARALIAAVLRFAETREKRRAAEARFEALCQAQPDAIGPRSRYALADPWRDVLARSSLGVSK